MSHVAPHRWADAWAGKVEAGVRDAMNRHADDCPRCDRARARVRSASDSFGTIRAQGAPDLPWDAVRARVHWSVSTERNTARHARQRPRPSAAWFALAAAGVATLAVAIPTALDPRAPLAALVAAPRAIADAPAARPAPAAALAGLVTRATGDVMIDGLRARDLFARRLAAGNRLATADGRVDVQFGADSAFAIGPRSLVELRAFDAATVELVIDGTIDVDVAHRAAGQRFVVRAGSREIEVRGTQFRVTHDARTGTTVACRHGVVAVRVIDAGAAGAPVTEVHAGHALTAGALRPLSTDELATLADARPLSLPVWNLDALIAGSAPLEIATAGRREVRVDGVELGAAPLQVRVMPGRHTVEAADAAGRFRRAGWVDVAAGAALARVEVATEAEPAPTARRSGSTSARRRELLSGLDRAALDRCTRRFAKAGLSGTFVQIELAVDDQGAVGFLNVLDTDLPLATARCVRDAIAEVRFAAGRPASWRERIEL